MVIRTVLAILLLSSATGEYFEGNGDIYITYSYNPWGIKIVYRPEYGGEKDPDPSQERAFIKIYQFNNGESARLYHDEKLRTATWNPLYWESIGGYYYYDTTRGKVEPYTWIAYEVKIVRYDTYGDVTMVYRDVNIYETPSVLEPCELDYGWYEDTSYKCSQALDGEARRTTTSYKSYQPTTADDDAGGNFSITVAIGVFPPLLIIVCGITMLCCVRKRGYCGVSNTDDYAWSASAQEDALADGPTGIAASTDSNTPSPEYISVSRQDTPYLAVDTQDDLPPSYTIAMHNSTSDNTSQHAPNDEEQLPSYVSVAGIGHPV